MSYSTNGLAFGILRLVFHVELMYLIQFDSLELAL
jgi:hypothetical protein